MSPIQSTLSLVALALISGGAGAFVVHSLRPEPEAFEAERSRPIDRSSAEDYALAAAIDGIRSDLEALRLRVDDLAQPAAVIPTDSLSAKHMRDQVTALAEKLDALELAPRDAPEPGLVLAGGKPTPEFTKAVADSMERLRRQETASKWKVGTQKRHAQIEDRLAKMQVQLNLDHGQVDSLRRAYATQRDQSLEVIRLWQEGDAEGAGALKQTNAAQHRATLERILTPAQLEQYQQTPQGAEK